MEINSINKIQHFDMKRLCGTYPCGNQNEMHVYRKVNKAELDSYVADLCNEGYEKKEELSVNGNSFISLLSKNDLIHIFYNESSYILKVISDPLCETVYYESESCYETYAATSLAPISLDYSHREITDGNGMAFIITLTDGRFIIIDGGYGDYQTEDELKEPRDAHILYEYMKNSNKRPDKKIIIAAWIITHPHADHYGAFVKFTSLYANEVSVESFIFNNGEPETYSKQYPTGDFLRKKIFEIVDSSYPNAKIIKPHVGQTLTFCDVKFTVLHTHEACIPNILPATNDTSLVLKITINGIDTLLMGDCDEGISSLLVNTFGNFLKSDIIQVNHHGYSGATVELYDTVLPSYTLWPTSSEAFKLRVTGEKYAFIGNAVASNKYICDRLTKEKCIVADGTQKRFFFNGGEIEIDTF